jgi:hypothetical protein
LALRQQIMVLERQLGTEKVRFDPKTEETRQRRIAKAVSTLRDDGTVR